MLAQPRTTRIPIRAREDALLRAVETALAQYQDWKQTRRNIQTQIVFNFKSPFLPTQDQVCEALQHFDIFALALREIADQIEREVAETTDQLHDWLYD